MTERLKIFIAGSKALEHQRMMFRTVLSKLQNLWDVTIEARTFEDFPNTVIVGGRQKMDYNRYIAEEADVVAFIYNDKVGKITEEEFNVAYESLGEKKRPEILVYVNKSDNTQITGLKARMNELNQYYVEYDDDGDLSRKFMYDINRHMVSVSKNASKPKLARNSKRLLNKGTTMLPAYKSRGDMEYSYTLVLLGLVIGLVYMSGAMLGIDWMEGSPVNEVGIWEFLIYFVACVAGIVCLCKLGRPFRLVKESGIEYIEKSPSLFSFLNPYPYRLFSKEGKYGVLLYRFKYVAYYPEILIEAKYDSIEWVIHKHVFMLQNKGNISFMDNDGHLMSNVPEAYYTQLDE